ncbi:hypothetical protein KPH14_013055 [Odynerus spinipes]|uniref:Uncharacterized protein n=1 Tax=Odynerus spinipes TaxID=1348599 RepID=A0AAD9VHG8_9HYME|nr:hypothetical protein KPH14_013055 [Odynerus spinipes]
MQIDQQQQPSTSSQFQQQPQQFQQQQFPQQFQTQFQQQPQQPQQPTAQFQDIRNDFPQNLSLGQELFEGGNDNLRNILQT